MITAAIAVTILVALTILVHYEILRLASVLIPEEKHVRPRGRVVLVVFACFAAHTIEVWLFALAYYLFVDVFALGSFGGAHDGTFVDNIYFSAVSYTSLGFGDVYPVDNVRLISGVEALVGLLMIGWSASFTYLAMEKFWPMHGGRKLPIASARSLRGRHARSHNES
jgi:Ion channel